MKQLGISQRTQMMQRSRPKGVTASASTSQWRRYLRQMVVSLSSVSFTLAGSVVVIYTLSGKTRDIAVIATLIAVVGHVVHSMLEMNERHRERMQDEPSTATGAAKAVPAVEATE